MTETNNKSKSIGVNVAWNAFGSVAYMGCQWAMTIVVVWLSDGFDNAGLLALAMAMGNLFVPVAQYRMRTYQVSDVEGEHTTGQYLAFRLLTIGCALCLTMLYSVITNGASSLAVVVAYLIYKAIELVIDVFHGLDQINLRMDYIGISLLARGCLSLAGFVAGLAVFRDLLVAIVIMCILTLVFGICYDTRKASQFDSLRPAITCRVAWSLLRECLLPVVSLVACSAALTFPRQYLNLEFGEEMLGIYASVAAPIALIQSGASYVYSPLLGLFAKSYYSGDFRAFCRMLGKVSLGMLLLVAVVGAILELIGPMALQLLYGEGMGQYAYLILPMVICSVVTAYLWFLNDLLLVMRLNLRNAVCNVVGVVASILFTFPLVDLFDMNGVSFTGIVSYGVAVVLSAICVFSGLRKMRSSSDARSGGV